MADVYRAQCAVLVEGKLDEVRLRAALEQVIQQHEILRTVFQQLPGMEQPLQVIRDRAELSWEEEDLSGVAIEFELSTGPLVAVRLVRESERRHHLLISVPALCGDSRSLRNLVEQVSQSYDELSDEAEEVVQYADFSEWLNEVLEGEDGSLGRAYWRKQATFIKSADGSFEPQSISRTVQLRAHAIPLLASWQILLQKLAANPEIVIGSLYDGRRISQLHNTVGLLSKYLPIQVDSAVGPHVGQLLGALGEAARAAQDREEFFSWKESMATAEGVAYFPYCFEFYEQEAKFVGREVSFEITSQYSCIDRFDLKLCCVSHGDELRLEFHYDASQYERAEIELLARRYEAVLRSVLQQPEQEVSRVEVLSVRERAQLLEEWNDTRRDV